MRRVSKALLVAAMVAFGAFAPVATASAGPDKDGKGANPQLSQPSAVSIAAAPDLCLLFNQMTAAHNLVRKTHNVPQTHTVSGWFDVPCGNGTFMVPRGMQALVDLSATAELDCEGGTTTGWCEGRFLVNGTTTPVHPNNDGRSDSYAWDSAKGGFFDWSAHALDQEYAVRCPESSTTNAPCVFKFQLQAQLTAGATSLWLDDLTVRVDANYGPTTVTSVPAGASGSGVATTFVYPGLN